MAVALVTAALVLPFTAHTVTELEQWQADWHSRAMHSLDVGMMAERREMRANHAWFFDPQPKEVPSAGRTTRPSVAAPPPGNTGMGNGDVEQWRGLVAAYFLASDVNLALEVIRCESGGNPRAHNPSGASGLFQHMPQYWAARSAAAGWSGADIYDPTANVAVAAYLVAVDGWWHWNPSRGCW